MLYQLSYTHQKRQKSTKNPLSLQAKMQAFVGLAKHGGKLIDGPVQVFGAHDQRRGDAQHEVVGFFAQDASLGERFAKWPRRAIQFNSDQQSASANFANVRAFDLSQSGKQRHPSVAARWHSFSSSSTRIAARATAHANGLPPKVLPWLPGRKTSIASAELSTADTG